jgi:hypothetical protein
VTEDGKPTFVGSQQDIELAGRVFDLMLAQGQFYSDDAPIRRSLQQLSSYFVEQGEGTNPEQIAKRLDEILTANSTVFYRETANDDVYFVTTKKGSYHPSVRMRVGALPVITQRHMVGGATRTVAAPAKRPQFVSRDSSQIGDLQQLVKLQHTQPILKEQTPLMAPPKEKRPERAVAPAPVAPPPPPVKRAPQVETPQGVVINLSKSPVEILGKHREFFGNLLREKLVADQRFVSFGNDWMLAEQLVPLGKGELRQAREFIESSGGAESDESLATSVFSKEPDSEPAFRFSLNYQLAAEKRTFEFVGTANQNLWWIVGATSPRIVRSPLKPAEIGQDFKYLEDEPPVAKLPNNKWAHILTFYEWENGILPYSPEAKLLLPPPLLKEQKLAQLRFEAPQFETSTYVELHHPSGNRGGWIEGLGEILAVFVSGAKLIIARNPDKADTFTIQFEGKPVQETNVLLYDAKRNRFVFQPLPLSYQTDDAYLLERQHFNGLKDARRLDDANRRKGDAVIIFAFEKIGEKSTVDDKTVYRASLENLLPVINIEKPFSKASLLRFFTTHPHYQKDEAEEGYYTYTSD